MISISPPPRQHFKYGTVHFLRWLCQGRKLAMQPILLAAREKAILQNPTEATDAAATAAVSYVPAFLSIS
jgi:hypothetical protein